MIAAGMLRQNLSQYFRAKTAKLPLKETSSKSLLSHVNRLRCGGGGGGFLTEEKFEARRSCALRTLRKKADELEREVEQESKAKAAGGGDEGANSGDLPNGMDPTAMLDGMKGGMVGMVQNMVMMQGISHFFRGFVLLKVPFPLTNGFKGMFQRGLELQTLDTSYVSSVSWYFLVMYGLRGFFRLVMSDSSGESIDMMCSNEVQASLGNSVGAAKVNEFDAPAVLRKNADIMEVSLRYRTVVEDAEKRLLGSNYPKPKKNKFGKSSALGSKSGHHNPGDDMFGFGKKNGGKNKSNKNSEKHTVGTSKGIPRKNKKR